MLRRDHNGVDSRGSSILIADGDLGLAVGPEITEHSLLSHLRQAGSEPVCHVDRQGHQLLSLIAGIPEHQSLIACALAAGHLAILAATHFKGVIHAPGDVRRLGADRHRDAA